MNYIRNIECSCGDWEEMPIDESRHNSQHFKWQSNLASGQALYLCPCGQTVTSKTEKTELVN